MNNGDAADTPTLRFAEAVRNFAGVPPKRFAALLPHRDGIAELRLKGASFGMIRELLAMAGIEVAADTVRRFYRDVIEEPRSGGKRPPKRERSTAPAPRDLPAPSPAAAVAVPPAVAEQPRAARRRSAQPLISPVHFMTKQLNLILNGKGGVGKSFFALNFVQALKDRRLSHRAADTDDENSTLLRFHADAEFVNIQKPRESDRLFALLESTDLLIVDCRAASTDLFLDYFAEINLREVLGALNARLTLVTPVNHEADSVEQLRLLAARLNAECRYVVVKNQAHSEHFRIYEDSKTRARIVGELHGREITMSRLHDWLVTALNENNVTASKALTHPAFSLIDRQRLKHWQRLFQEQLALADDLLLPPQSKLTP